jgi:hypothetical protein
MDVCIDEYVKCDPRLETDWLMLIGARGEERSGRMKHTCHVFMLLI